jgi:epoxyqueuosine reductase
VLSQDYVDELTEAGCRAGLDRVGIASAEPFVQAHQALTERAAAGLASTMQFTYRNPARSTDPSATLAGVASLVVGALGYGHVRPEAPSQVAVAARVARYATDDHYRRLRVGLERVADRLRDDGWQARVLVDDNALVDRAAAHRAGLGWYGKNANVLVADLGSWVVLGSVLTDAPLPVAPEPVADGCGACTRCVGACPTGAIVAPGVVDARRCLAWLVQAEGVFPVELRAALGDRLYGCDECQEVCPPSRGGADGPDPGRSGASPHSAQPGDWVDVLDLLASDDATLLGRFGRWYIPRRQPRYLRRNALVVLGNSGRGDHPGVRRALGAALADEDPLVRAHAVWAARRLGLDVLVESVSTDRDPWVRAELDGPVDPPDGGAGLVARVVGRATGVAVASPGAARSSMGRGTSRR